METKVLIRSNPKPNAANPPPQWCFWWNLIMIGLLVSEIFMFESVNAQTDGRTDGRRLESHTIRSPCAFGSGELKIWTSFLFFLTFWTLFLNPYPSNIFLSRKCPLLFVFSYTHVFICTPENFYHGSKLYEPWSHWSEPILFAIQATKEHKQMRKQMTSVMSGRKSVECFFSQKFPAMCNLIISEKNLSSLSLLFPFCHFYISKSIILYSHLAYRVLLHAFCCLLIFFKIKFFEKFFQDYQNINVKQFGSISGPTK